jgi:hypothetical protein
MGMGMGRTMGRIMGDDCFEGEEMMVVRKKKEEGVVGRLGMVMRLHANG